MPLCTEKRWPKMPSLLGLRCKVRERRRGSIRVIHAFPDPLHCTPVWLHLDQQTFDQHPYPHRCVSNPTIYPHMLHDIYQIPWVALDIVPLVVTCFRYPSAILAVPTSTSGLGRLLNSTCSRRTCKGMYAHVYFYLSIPGWPASLYNH